MAKGAWPQRNRPVKLVPVALAVILWLAGCVSGFDPFSRKQTSDPNVLAAPGSAPTRARELQQEMMDFSDRYTMAVWQALDNFSRAEIDPVKRSAAEHLKVLFSSASMEIAAGRNSAGNLLDMAVFARLAGDAVDDYWVPEVFGPGAAPLIDAHRELNADLDILLERTLTEEQRRELDRMVTDYQKANPGSFYVADVRLRDLVSARTADGQAVGGIPLLADVSRAVGELDAAVEYGERLMFYVERLPRLTTMQTALALAQTGASPPVISLTESVRLTSESIAQMSEDITAAVAENSETLGVMLPGLQATVADSRAIAEITERILNADTGEPQPNPWTPEAATTALREAGIAASEIRDTLAEVEKSLATAESLPLEKLLNTTSQEIRLTIDYAWTRVLQAIGVLFAGVLVLLVIASRLFRSKGATTKS